ncbi:MAG: hypothetical protein LBR85_09415 [Oscillospiraceae bacterium]|jgi:hypothetical protein|nr:hypothetical protein [Oscillospiraceae bacterium]
MAAPQTDDIVVQPCAVLPGKREKLRKTAVLLQFSALDNSLRSGQNDFVCNLGRPYGRPY